MRRRKLKLYIMYIVGGKRKKERKNIEKIIKIQKDAVDG
jgi:hypothetical protein